MPESTSPRPSRRPVVGVRLPEWATFARPVFDGIMDHMRLRGWWDLRTENSAYGELETFRIDKDWSGDGLITFRATAEELAAWRERGVAVVNISSEGPAGGFPRVIPDNPEIGRLAARHLRECGLTNFAYISRGEALYPRRVEWTGGVRRYGRERYAGYAEELARSGCAAVPFFLPPLEYDAADTWSEVLRLIGDFIVSLPKPCGVFVCDDLLGVSVLRAAVSRGVTVPESMPVVAFGDDKVFCNLVTPPLGSVCYPGRELGLAAARLLDAQFAGEKELPAETIIPVTDVTRRESSDYLAIGDEEVARLVRLIRERAPHEALLVTEVFESSGLSPTVIKQRFNAVFGHGPKQEILNVRGAHLRRLLVDTRLPISEIATSTGFASATEMGRFIERHLGERIADLRRQPR